MIAHLEQGACEIRIEKKANHAITPLEQRAYDCRLLAIICLISGLLFGLLGWSGCAHVGPDYVPPNPALPAKWRAELSGGLTASSLDPQAMAGWWARLNDPVLSSLMGRAVSGNLELRRSQARLLEARARRGISRSDRFPELRASGSAAASRTRGRQSNLFEAGFDAGWELDLFGGVQRSIEAAEAEAEASQEELWDVLVSLTAEVALNYVEVRLLQSRLAIAEESLKAQEETYQLILWRSEAGLASDLEVEEAKSNLEESRSLIPSLRTSLDQTLNRLALLLGKNPGSLNEELSSPAPIPIAPPEVAIGVPAEVLHRVPAVRKAERQLAAQTARVGVAESERYPKFSLSGSIGLESAAFTDLLTPAARQILRIGQKFSWPLFDAGRIRQNVEVQNCLREQAVIAYQQAILTALKDVEDALVAFAQEQVRRQHLVEASQAARRAEELARSRYLCGLIDFQTVLDTQRSWLSLKNQLAISDSEVVCNLIRLYKALGGGWTNYSTEAAPHFLGANELPKDTAGAFSASSSTPWERIGMRLNGEKVNGKEK
ncbi:MAG: efflux transporter outer membrane subunit [bacterium]|nr:efflux transporter outer membrane subunit [bacterium]